MMDEKILKQKPKEDCERDKSETNIIQKSQRRAKISKKNSRRIK